MLGWWNSSDTAFQWEEIANVVSSLPRCCALSGVVKPMRTASVPLVGSWYRPESLIASRSVEEALQGLFYVPTLSIGWQISDLHAGTTTTTVVTRKVNYRNSFSDWQFAPEYRKDFVRIHLVFRINALDASLTAHHGPLGSTAWKWYVSRPVEDSDVDPAYDDPVGLTPPAGASALPAPPFIESPLAAQQPALQAPQLTTTLSPTTVPPATTPAQPMLPLALSAKLDRVITVLHDAGQPTAWLDSMKLGLERNYGQTTPWETRDREGRMRAAWDAVEQLDPIATLVAVPNGARSNVATLLGQLYKAAATVAHSPTAARGWVGEAVRMAARGRALAECSAITPVELEDYTTPLRVQNSAGINQANISALLAAGIPASSIVALPPLKRGETHITPQLTTELPQVLATAEEGQLSEMESIVKESFDSHQIDAATVTEILGYQPPWAITTTGAADAPQPISDLIGTLESVPDVTLPPTGDPAEQLQPSGVDLNIGTAGESLASIRASIPPAFGMEPPPPQTADFGPNSNTTGMLPPITPQPTSIQSSPIPPQPTPESLPPVDLAVVAARAMGFIP
jgi:hypothetical protein